jgi:hypothetical protein
MVILPWLAAGLTVLCWVIAVAAYAPPLSEKMSASNEMASAGDCGTRARNRRMTFLPGR